MNWFSTYRVHHRVAAKFREGRAFLLGDAAHIHSPVGGQGMNTGIGDAVNLAWKLAAVLERKRGRQPSRHATSRSASASLAGWSPRPIACFAFVTDQGPIAWRVRTRLLPLRGALPVSTGTRVRRFLFRTVSQIGVNYPDSPLSEGATGSVKGGDRLPWIRTGREDDNFGPLTSLAWQVQVYGEPRHGMADACAELGLPIHAFSWTPTMERCGLVRGPLSRPAGRVYRSGRPGRRSTALEPLLQKSRLVGHTSTRRCNQSPRSPLRPGSPIGTVPTTAPMTFLASARMLPFARVRKAL